MTIQEANVLFNQLVRRKTEQASRSVIPGYVTDEDRTSVFLKKLGAFGTPWSMRLFDGLFYYSLATPDQSLPVVNTVFVRDLNGNTDPSSGNPADLGGGESDLHLIYETLSRARVDAVMAGANSVRGLPEGLVYGIWHEQGVFLRQQLQKPFYPEQVIVTGRGEIDCDRELMFNLPQLKVYVITTKQGADRLEPQLQRRSWVQMVISGEKTLDFKNALRTLKQEHAIASLCLVGGRTVANSLFAAGLISDVYLTTTPSTVGRANTGLNLPLMDLVLRKQGKREEQGIVFEHWLVRRSKPLF